MLQLWKIGQACAASGRFDGTIMAGQRAETRLRGVIYGRSLDLKPQPMAADILASPIRLTDVEYVVLPQKGWRDRLQLFMQSSGLTTIPAATRLRWQAQDVQDWLQGSLLGRSRGRRAAITHPIQLMHAVEFMMGLPGELDVERRMIHLLLGRGMIEYRKRISQGRERPMVFAREAGTHFIAGFKDQQMLNRGGSPAEQFQTVQKIYTSYYFFRLFYICSILCREPAESGNKLFSKFMRASFFMSTIQEDGTVAPKPSYRSLPPKEHVVFLAKRDMALQSRLLEDEQLRVEMQGLLRYFRPLRT